jgi:YfiH family protein
MSTGGRMHADPGYRPWFVPDWDVPAPVRVLITTRRGGVSVAPFDAFNLGAACGDDPHAVGENRARLRGALPAEPRWLKQVHGTLVADAERVGAPLEADAACTRVPRVVCAVLTADCLPLLLCNADGSMVAAVHAGWRGLSGGVIEAAVRRFDPPHAQLRAYLGPAISARAYEVGEDVHQAFTARGAEDAAAFAAKGSGKYWCDLYHLARLHLARAGITRVSGGEFCTYSDPARFYSYRRDGRTGRTAALIWMA